MVSVQDQNYTRTSLKPSHLWLYMKDIERSISFYQNTLGLQILQSFPDGALFRGDILIGIHKEEGERKSRPGGILVTFQTDDIVATRKELEHKGVTFLNSKVQSASFGQFADFLDPDGYVLEIWQPPKRQSK